jgi:RNA polymerase sigma-70 factor, ECF subfamily
MNATETMGSLAQRWSQDWYRPLLRYARLHLNYSQQDAEDAVQDVFLAVLQLEAQEWQNKDPRAYLFGILRNKILDKLRGHYRQQTRFTDVPDEDMDALLFDQREHWVKHVAPQSWATPDESALQDAFFKVVDVCVSQLPQKTARVFSMKELLDCEPQEICQTLGISQADYWQSMSRARKQLHLCLNHSWFGAKVYA